MNSRIGIGLIGAGWAAGIHARGYQHASDLGARVVAVAAKHQGRAEAFAARYDIPTFSDNAMSVIASPEVDIVDLTVPNVHHHAMAVAAARAGKHIICEKPLAGFFGPGATTRTEMLEQALRNADSMVEAALANGVKLMYAENLIYAPAVAKARRLIEASGSVLLEIRGEESHSGSHASYAKSWRESGGGSLLRLGTHPIGVALHLKRCEGMRRSGVPVRPASVVAEVGCLTKIPAFQAEDLPWLVKDWDDVEDWSSVILTFSDGSRGSFIATDTLLGGMRDRLEFSLGNAHIICDLTHSGQVRAYAPDPAVFATEYLAEKLETTAGWSFVSLEEEWTLGYPHELRDFVEAVAKDRPPISDADLGRDVLNVIYSAYLSAAEGRRVSVNAAAGTRPV